MAVYRVLHTQMPFRVEADKVNFNLEAGMVFFTMNDGEVVAAIRDDVAFVKADAEVTTKAKTEKVTVGGDV